jgi:purine catabolism regulator
MHCRFAHGPIRTICTLLCAVLDKKDAMVYLRSIVDIDDLHIDVVHGSHLLDVELSGAHASEQPDPTPWLAGGELLMSDGLGIRPDHTEQVDYMARLKRKRIAAIILGLGGSLPYGKPPDGLVDGARKHDLPLLTVPVTTPFIAITQAVYIRMSHERAAMSERILAAHAPLTAAAASDAPLPEIVSVFGQQVNGWAMVCDSTGRAVVDAMTPVPGVHAAVHEHLVRYGRKGLHASFSGADAAGAYAIRPIGIDKLRGLFVYGRSEGRLGDQFTGSVAGYATALLSIEMERRHAVALIERRPGADVVRRLLAGADGARAAQVLATVGVTSERIQVLCASAPVPDDLADTIADSVPEALLLAAESGVTAIVPADPAVVERLHSILACAYAGLGGAVRPHQCGASYRQARQAQAESRRRGTGLVEAVGLGDAQVLLQLVSSDGLTTFADAVLGGVEGAPNGPALIRSLRAFLISGATIEDGSTAAKVHRHTMRRHLRRVEELTGRRLDNARDRTELWLAFEARDVAATL